MEPSPKSAAKPRAGIFRLLDFLLLAVPAALAIRWVPSWRNDTTLFIVAGLGIVPLAGWRGCATEHLGARADPGFGGLLNATFGNAAELIIALMALSKGLVGVVKASITGSIIGNILLVLGASIFAVLLFFFPPEHSSPEKPSHPSRIHPSLASLPSAANLRHPPIVIPSSNSTTTQPCIAYSMKRQVPS